MRCCAPKAPNSQTEIKLSRQVLWYLTELNQVIFQLVIQYITLFLCCGPFNITEIQMVKHFKKTQKKHKNVPAVLVKFNLQLLGIQINRFFIHLKVAHKSISYTISYTSWMPKLGKEVAKITFSPF